MEEAICCPVENNSYGGLGHGKLCACCSGLSVVRRTIGFPVYACTRALGTSYLWLIGEVLFPMPVVYYFVLRILYARREEKSRNQRLGK